MIKSGEIFERAGFPFLLSLFLIASFAIGLFMPCGIEGSLQGMTSAGAVDLAKGLGLSAFVEHGSIISIEGKRLSIVSECTAINYLLIFASAVLAYPTAFRRKAYGLLFGIPLIICINLFRIVFLGWLGGHYPAHFRLVHDYLWEGGFLLVVMLIWVAWVNLLTSETRRREVNHRNPLALWERAGVRVPVILALTIASVLFFSDAYLKSIANASNYLIHILGIDGGVIRSDGKGLFLIFWGQAPLEVSIGIYYLLPFITLTLLFPRKCSGGVIPKLTIGILALTLIQILATLGTFMAISSNTASWKIEAISAAVTVSPIIVYGLQFVWAGLLPANNKREGTSPSPTETLLQTQRSLGNFRANGHTPLLET